MYVNQPLNPKKKRRWWLMPLIAIALVLVVVIGYVTYVFSSYTRIRDLTPIEPNGTAKSESVKLDKEYTALTYNVGFGAYTPDFSFFMDGGESSWAKSKESVVECIDGVADVIEENETDFALLQEVDYDSTRSYHVDERSQLIERFPDHSSVFAINYHSPFLMYPFTQPHGASYSGLLTLSESPINSAVRRSLPITTDIKKLLDLDRCYSVIGIPVENGKDLMIYNTHMSAYGTNGGLLEQQLNMIFEDMKAEYDNGNYVICGGDFNHDFLGNSKEIFNDEVPEQYSWAAEFPDELIPEHFSKVTDYASGVTVPSCRNCDKPAGPDCFTVTVDGFIVSDNVETTFVDVVDNQFLYSDHNPVEMKFKLK